MINDILLKLYETKERQLILNQQITTNERQLIIKSAYFLVSNDIATLKSEYFIGRIDDYMGIRFTQKAPNGSGNLRLRTLTLHPNHNGHGIHWQLNKLSKYNDIISRSGVEGRWKLWLIKVRKG